MYIYIYRDVLNWARAGLRSINLAQNQSHQETSKSDLTQSWAIEKTFNLRFLRNFLGRAWSIFASNWQGRDFDSFTAVDLSIPFIGRFVSNLQCFYYSIAFTGVNFVPFGPL